MPRLGSNDGRSSSPRRNPPAQAYARRMPRVNIKNVAIFFAAFFIARNILRNDYRSEEMTYLKGSGMSAEEIEHFIPKTAEERRQYVQSKANDLEHMKNDIAYLLQEVAEVKSQVNNYKPVSRGSRESGFIEMDHLHKEKRKQKEEQLLKDHPDFKPSPRLSPEERLKKVTGDTTDTA